MIYLNKALDMQQVTVLLPANWSKCQSCLEPVALITHVQKNSTIYTCIIHCTWLEECLLMKTTLFNQSVFIFFMTFIL